MTHADLLRLKAEIRERDGMCCVECSTTNADHLTKTGKSLEVHRVVPGSEYSLAPGVCVTLCQTCHKTKPRRPRGTLPKKPGRVLGIPIPLHERLKPLAAEEFTSVTQQAIIAIREYLRRKEQPSQDVK